MSTSTGPQGMGCADVHAEIDLDALREPHQRHRGPLERLGRRAARAARACAWSGAPAAWSGPHEVVVDTADGRRGRSTADVIAAVAPAAGRASPTGRTVDGERVLTTRDAYPPPELPEHLVVIGSGVTGVEFVHMFSSFGCEVTLIVSRQQVLPPEGPRGGGRARGRLPRVAACSCSRAPGPTGIDVDRRRRRGALRRRPAGRRARHVLLAIGSIPNSEGLGLDDAGRRGRRAATSSSTTTAGRTCRTSTPPATCPGKLPLSSVASMQGRKIAEHAMGLHQAPHRHLDYDKAASAIFTEPEIADVGPGRGRRVRRRAARSGSPRCRSRRRPRRSSTTTPGAS